MSCKIILGAGAILNPNFSRSPSKTGDDVSRLRPARSRQKCHTQEGASGIPERYTCQQSGSTKRLEAN